MILIVPYKDVTIPLNTVQQTHYFIYFITDVFEGIIKCDCPLACDVINYESTVSSAVFPNPTMIKILQNEGYNRTKDYLRWAFQKLLQQRTGHYMENITSFATYDIFSVKLRKLQTLQIYLWNVIVQQERKASLRPKKTKPQTAIIQ